MAEAQAVAEQAEMRKRSEYEIIARTHHFVPVVVETSGSPGPVCRERQAGPRSHTRGQGTGLPPPAGVRSPAAWQCSISVGVNGLCLTFNMIELAHHLI